MELRDLIKSKDYSSRLEHIEKIVGNIAGKTRILFPKYTNHGVDHLRNVERHANNIIPDDIKEKLSEEEIFCLLAGIWLHDIGMMPIDEDIDIYESKSEKDREKYRNTIRELHHVRSENYIKKNYEELGLNKLEAKIIGKIAKSHRRIKLNELEKIMYKGKLLDISVLGAIVRLADECDISKNRETPLSSEGIDEDTIEKHYSIHDFVNEVWIDHENQTIYLSCIIENEKEYKPIVEKQKEIQNKLEQTKDFLKNLGIELEKVQLDIHDEFILEKEIICKIANDEFDIEEWNLKNTKLHQIHDLLDKLKAENLFEDDEYNSGFKKSFSVYKKLFKKFNGSNNLKNFYFTKYSQETIEKCFKNIESKFNAGFLSKRKSRIKILKNSPTAFELILTFEKTIGDSKFKLNYNKNGDWIIDFLLLASIFNDIYYYNDQIDFETVKNKINDLIEDKQNLDKKINKHEPSFPDIHFSKEDENERIPFSIKLNVHEGFEDHIDLNPTIENPIKITGERIKYIEIGEGEDYKKFTPDLILITKPSGLKIKINNKLYDLEFKQEKLSENTILFTSKPSKDLDLILKLKFKFDFKANNHKFSLSIIPKTNNIEDILYQTKFKYECSEKNIEIIFNEKTIFSNHFPKTNIDYEFIMFLDKLNKINNELNLDLIYEEDYEITEKDRTNVEILCSYIKNKTIEAENIRAKFKITLSQLNDIIEHEHKDVDIMNPHYNIKILNKTLDLGQFHTKINSLKIINKDELMNLINTHESDKLVNVEIVMTDEKSELILDFNENNPANTEKHTN